MVRKSGQQHCPVVIVNMSTKAVDSTWKTPPTWFYSFTELWSALSLLPFWDYYYRSKQICQGKRQLL